MNLTETVLRRASTHYRRIAFCEPGDSRTLEAAAKLADEGIVEPLFVGETGPEHDGALRGLPVIDAGDHAVRTAMALVRDGHAAGIVAGLQHAGGELAGLWDTQRSACSFSLVELEQPTEAGDRALVFADMGLVDAPGPERLAAIACAAAREFRRLTGAEPRVAMLSFSTHGSATHGSIERVTRATALARELDPGLRIDGELQADAALVPSVAAKKAGQSDVAGSANVLVFPDPAAATITASLVAGRCTFFGPFLSGLDFPANRVSPEASASDIVWAAAVTALQAD